jgi:hypothetical protein
MNRLREAGEYTDRTGYEAGFEVARDINKGFILSSVAKGELYSHTIDTKLEGPEFDRDLDILETYPFFRFHFHMDPEEPIYPSEKDLYIYDDRNERPILGVGQIFRDKDIQIILVQNKRELGKLERAEFFSEYDDVRFNVKCQTNQEVVDFFRKSGLYDSSVIHYEYDLESGLYLPQFSQNDFEQFSHEVDLEGMPYKSWEVIVEEMEKKEESLASGL